MLKAFIRGCRKARTTEEAARLSIAATPFPLPEKAKHPFNVSETIPVRDAEDSIGTGMRLANLMDTLVKQGCNVASRSINFNPDPPPLVMFVII